MRGVLEFNLWKRCVKRCEVRAGQGLSVLSYLAKNGKERIDGVRNIGSKLRGLVGHTHRSADGQHGVSERLQDDRGGVVGDAAGSFAKGLVTDVKVFCRLPSARGRSPGVARRRPVYEGAR